ncbi:acyl transferase/acyl hydrolase/lysophospholipase [Lineolata rhizophorae]|uniref:Acyl transferase/acyl hydrolase/lysophospholipase n=1 Tax=Lineolata rhizophorae TaxID=578093 RepID=A0A6A6NUW5_9PEZI|nr:acyl transferase/acyl hydrolase/lysophospholipase [Lineolata rhizophorae]
MAQRPSPRLGSWPVSVATSAEDDHNGTAWAQHVRDPWDVLILTLDGGGIRGYSSLLILKQLMRDIAKWENTLEREGRAEGDNTPVKIFSEEQLLPCHYFDYMYGTSTGGLIATMLGRLRMTVPQCLEIYRQVGNDLFGHRRSIVPLTTKYHHKPLEIAVQRIVREHCKRHGPECTGEDWYPWPSEEGSSASPLKEENAEDQESSAETERICQSICLTATHNGRIDEAHLLRTYDHRSRNPPNWITIYNQGADKLRIWQVTRATSAAPFYFKMLEADIRGEVHGFKDGGIRENNPAGAAWSEFVSLYGEDNNPALLLSIGTGRPDHSQDGFASAWPGPFGNFTAVKKAAEKFAVFKNVLIKYTEGEEKHKAMLQLARGEHRWYKRLNVSTGLEKLKLDNWEKGRWQDPATGVEEVVPGGKTLKHMEEVTRHYLAREIDREYDTYAPPKIKLDQAAEKLVRHRRARERTADMDRRRWDTFMGRYLTGDFSLDQEGVAVHS